MVVIVSVLKDAAAAARAAELAALTRAALEEYLARLQAADLARIITEPGLICTDFADVWAIMRIGSSAASLGVGIARGEGGAREAALKALRSLERQGVDPGSSPALLVSISGSSNMTMDDFDSDAKTVHGAVAEEANIIVTLLVDDVLAGNIRVMIMAKRDAA